MAAPNHYQLLGVDPAASIAQIRAAYRARAKRLHPDVNREPGAQEAFAQLAEAYEVLSDRGRRREYDEQLAQCDTRPADPATAHYTWQNVAAANSADAERERASEFDELYETFFRPHKPEE